MNEIFFIFFFFFILSIELLDLSLTSLTVLQYISQTYTFTKNLFILIDNKVKHTTLQNYVASHSS